MGKFCIAYLNLKENFFSKTLIVGFLAVVFIQWLIGFPCQLFHLSWNIYFWLMLVVNGTVFVVLTIYYKNNYVFKRDYIKKKGKTNLKKYWFLYALVVVFSLWSMTSQLPYFIMNYDDHYYLGAIIQQTNSVALSTENFFNGVPMEHNISRLINTFEINYAFWANLFHIYPVFFARAVMVIHNYLLIFMAFHAFFSVFTKIDEKYIQFTLIPFVVLLIPAGLLEQKNIVRVYDGWQMNTAVWYGGSMVRMTCLPVLIMFAYEITEKINFRRIVFICVICVSYLSFSSIALPFIIIGFIIGWLLLSYRVLQKDWKHSTVLSVFMFFLLFISIKFGPKVIEILIPSQQESMINAVAAYRNMRSYYINDNYIYIISSSLILFNAVFKRHKNITVVGIIVLICVFVCYGTYFDKFFVLISMKYDFVALRLITGLQMLLLLYIGFYLFDVIQMIKNKSLPFIAVSSITCACLFNFFNMQLYKSSEFNRIGTGMSVFGYSFTRLINNTNMTPSIYKDLYTYFEKETGERYRIINPTVIRYEDGNLFLYAGMGFAANNIEACITDANQKCDDMSNGDMRMLSDYASGVNTYDDIKELLEAYKIEYILTPSEKVVAEMKEKGHPCVMVSKSLNEDILSLIKIR